MTENSIPEAEPAAPGCQVCGCRNETLRLVSYPFAISVVILTFRRAFSGVWCARHRRLRHFLAILITSTIGWMGVPFGLLYAPLTLIQLATGGQQPKDANARLLRALGEEKCREGDYEGARRCYEAALLYSDDPAVEAEVRRLAVASITTREEPSNSIFLTVLTGAGTLLVLAFLIGLAAGALSDVLLALVWQVRAESGTIFEDILTWIPELVLTVLGIFLLKALFDWVIDRLHVTIDALAGALAITAALLFMYASLAGEMLLELLRYRLYEPSMFVPANLLRDILAAILRGGVLNVADTLSRGDLPATIKLVLSVLLTAYAVFTLTNSGSRSTTWRARIAELEPNGRYFRMPAQPALLAIVAVPVMVAGMAFALPQKSMVDSLQAVYKVQDAYKLWSAETPDLAEVQHLLEEAIRLNPGVASPHLLLANLLNNQGQAERAENELNAAAAIAPDNPSVYLIRGHLLLAKGDLDGSREAYQRCIDLDPTISTAHSGLGWLALYQNDLESARARFEKALALDPGDAEAAGGLGMVDYQENKIDAAIEHLSGAIRGGVSGAAQQETLALAYLTAGKLDLAVSQAKQFTEVLPGHTIPPALLAIVYYNRGETDQESEQIELALQAYQDPATSDGDYGALYLSSALTSANRFSEAEKILLNALETTAHPDKTYSLLASVVLHQGRADEARAYVDQAAQAGQAEVENILDQAKIALYQGNAKGGLALLEKARSLDVENDQVITKLASMYYYTGQYSKSLETAAAALAILPYSDEVLTYQSLAYRANDQLPEAIAAAQKAVEISPGFDLAQFALGSALAGNNQLDEARPALQRFLELYWDRPYARAHKAEAEKWLKQ
jgi:tetratricopeptide (TPR) repeat protein